MLRRERPQRTLADTDDKRHADLPAAHVTQLRGVVDQLVEAQEPVKRAGGMIIDYIDDKGYLTVRLEQLHNKDKHDFDMNNLNEAIKLVQKLEPTGVGARDLKECLLIQMAQFAEDMSFECRLVKNHHLQLYLLVKNYLLLRLKPGTYKLVNLCLPRTNYLHQLLRNRLHQLKNLHRLKNNLHQKNLW